MLRIAAALIVVLAIFVWFADSHPSLGFTAPPSVSLAPLTASAIAAERVTLPPFDGDGVVIIDESQGMPGTMYLVYENTNGAVGTKLLLDVPALPSGTVLHVVGAVADDGIQVQQYEVVNDAPTGMSIFSVQEGHAAMLSNGLSITPESVATDASCTLGVGCVGNGIPRVTMVLGVNNTSPSAPDRSSRTTDIVPGMLTVFGKSSVSLLSVSGSGAAAVFSFLVADTK